MRFNSTQKYFLFFILGMALLLALVYFLAFIVPDVGQYVYMVVLGIAGIFILYVCFLPLLSFLSERADTILNIYLDESDRGIHIFSAFSVSRYKVFRPSVRYIQHYFIITESGKLYYKVLFSHSMAPLAGQSGYDGFHSFEKDVLESDALRQSMAGFSRKTSQHLQLGKRVGKGDEDHYRFSTAGHLILIDKKTGTLEDRFEVTCYTADEQKRLWTRKI